MASSSISELKHNHSYQINSFPVLLFSTIVSTILTMACFKSFLTLVIFLLAGGHKILAAPLPHSTDVNMPPDVSHMTQDVCTHLPLKLCLIALPANHPSSQRITLSVSVHIYPHHSMLCSPVHHLASTHVLKPDLAHTSTDATINRSCSSNSEHKHGLQHDHNTTRERRNEYPFR